MKDHIDFIELEKLDRTVEKVLKKNNLQDILYFSKIYKHWEIIVGKPLAAKTFPVKLSKKTLTVNVEDAAYSHHLKYYTQNILDLIASPEICGEGVVKKISYKVGKKAELKGELSLIDLTEKVIKADQVITEEAFMTGDVISDKKLKHTFIRMMSNRFKKNNATE